jgi:hypothetical protein
MARSHAPFLVLLAYKDDLALAIIAPVATQARHQAATRDLLELKAIPKGTFRGARGIRKHACFVYKMSCTVVALSAIHTGSSPLHISSSPPKALAQRFNLGPSFTTLNTMSQTTVSKQATINPSVLRLPSPLKPIRAPLITPVTLSSHL